MARIRTIKPELFCSESLANVPLAAERTFMGLLTQADDHGRLRFNAAVLNGALWPLRPDHTPADLEADVSALIDEGVICRYEVDGKTYLHFPTWGTHQKISHPSTRNQAPACPDHEPAAANATVEVEVKRPKARSRHIATAEPVDTDDTSTATTPAAQADEHTGEEASDMGIYDNPVEAFAELHPVDAAKKPTRKRKKADDSTPTGPATTASLTPAQIANAAAQEFYDSIQGLGDFQKIRTVVTKAVKAGYDRDRIVEGLQSAHRDGRPLTADVLHQYLEGFARRAGRAPDKAIHYAADKPHDPSQFREEW